MHQQAQGPKDATRGKYRIRTIKHEGIKSWTARYKQKAELTCVSFWKMSCKGSTAGKLGMPEALLP
ncbi:hypothetical protein RvY_11385 [Ramazzottius varieornatus]|uniref:Uncharacterized protein n=1 Tax=Ramazzottius varieornatus TaxID=947166 RepID=A0A1D1VNN5_RAMVA|nr:hypothetical protein RvY_11385 [Ramazzottius varieornatus]